METDLLCCHELISLNLSSTFPVLPGPLYLFYPEWWKFSRKVLLETVLIEMESVISTLTLKWRILVNFSQFFRIYWRRPADRLSGLEKGCLPLLSLANRKFHALPLCFLLGKEPDQKGCVTGLVFRNQHCFLSWPVILTRFFASYTFFFINNKKFKQSPRKSLIC